MTRLGMLIPNHVTTVQSYCDDNVCSSQIGNNECDLMTIIEHSLSESVIGEYHGPYSVMSAILCGRIRKGDDQFLSCDIPPIEKSGHHAAKEDAQGPHLVCNQPCPPLKASNSPWECRQKQLLQVTYNTNI